MSKLCSGHPRPSPVACSSMQGLSRNILSTSSGACLDMLGACPSVLGSWSRKTPMYVLAVLGACSENASGKCQVRLKHVREDARRMLAKEHQTTCLGHLGHARACLNRPDHARLWGMTQQVQSISQIFWGIPKQACSGHPRCMPQHCLEHAQRMPPRAICQGMLERAQSISQHSQCIFPGGIT